ANTSYTSNLLTIAGCDSIITTNVTMDSVYNQTENISACNNSTVTYPDGTTATITANTSYTSNLLSISGCDSIIISNVTVDSVSTIICQDISLYLNSTGNASISANNIDGGSTSSCGIVSITTSNTNFNCNDIGPNNVTLYVTNNGGNIDSCVAIVTVIDTILPIVICQDITIYLDNNGNATILDSDLNNGSNDSCGVVSVVASQTTFNCTDIGINNITLIISDVNGNIDSCIAIVTVIDTISPTVSCQNITLYLDINGNSSTTANDLDNASSDICGIASLTISQNTFTCNNLGTNNITLIVTDNNGNTDSCTSTVTVLDTISPSIICQSNRNEYLDSNCKFIIPDYSINSTISDNCTSITNFTITQTPTAGTLLYNVGTTQYISITIEDESGNIDSCGFTITLLDNIPPELTCPLDQMVETDFTCVYEINDYRTLITNNLDNCDINNLTITQVPPPNSMITADHTNGIDTEGQTVVTITIEDQSGNINFCDFIVNVTCITDLTIPQFISPNGDGSNDYLVIKGVEVYPENTITIFNRWGDIIYTASPYLNDWNGTSDKALYGEKVPDGSYFYSFKSSPDADKISGYIVIKR
ncbi:MAG: gliding motility-associated C-terminal domain-containing protein, partial [Flavobacteriales bacterium]|nr:gliding motility-associated C-terminal domain-containing protein [Flavobacteriales bacterium]